MPNRRIRAFSPDFSNASQFLWSRKAISVTAYLARDEDDEGSCQISLKEQKQMNLWRIIQVAW